MVTDVLSSRNLLYHSKEANAHEGKCFCVVAVLFAYFGIFALTFLKYLTRLYASQNHCCRSSQCINTGKISGKYFFEIFFWVKHFDPPTLPTNQKQR